MLLTLLIARIDIMTKLQYFIHAWIILKDHYIVGFDNFIMNIPELFSKDTVVIFPHFFT